jgi:hypothetical protein
MAGWWIRGYRTRLLSDEDVREEFNRVDTHSCIRLTRALAQPPEDTVRRNVPISQDLASIRPVRRPG